MYSKKAFNKRLKDEEMYAKKKYFSSHIYSKRRTEDVDYDVARFEGKQARLGKLRKNFT